MEVKIQQAVKMFFGNSSFESVYFEAIANSLDAGATKIKIEIRANSYSKTETLQIVIEDNGIGFTDERYKKFCRLFDVEESSHKGLGRLIFPCYFRKIVIESIYNKKFHREFEFNENTSYENSKVTLIQEEKDSSVIIRLKEYNLSKLKSYSFIKPEDIKNRILEKFYPRLYKYKVENKDVEIEIDAVIEGNEASISLATSELPEFEVIELKTPLSALDKFSLHYYIKETPNKLSKIITAIAVDNRTHIIDFIAKENIQIGYEMVFILYSEFFTGSIDLVREELTLSETKKIEVQEMFKDKVVELIALKLPNLAEQNKKRRQSIEDKFPHLTGLFNNRDIGYISENKVIEKAQNKFFSEQKKLLEATSLTDKQYSQSLELSARALTEYILFRQMIIQKLKRIKKKDTESEIHNLIVPKYNRFEKKDFLKDLYRNNAWLLDDKYMTYETILSEKTMSDLVGIITKGEQKEDDTGIPDISIVFSNDPNKVEKVDVVIVEIKRKGLSDEDNMKVETQIRKRARTLMKLYKNRIQRIWLYGIIEFNASLENLLKDEYKQLYSTGKMYFKPTEVHIQDDPEIRLPIVIFMLDLNSIVNDADARNSTFLRIIKSKFKEKIVKSF